MAQSRQTVLTGKNSKQVKTRFGERIVFSYRTQDDQWLDTFNTDVANVADALLNQPVMVSWEAKQNGEYTNYTLLSVAPAGAPAANASSPVSSAGHPAPAGGADRSIQIMRQSADKVAAQIVAAFINAGKIEVAGTASISSLLTGIAEKRLAYYQSGSAEPAAGTGGELPLPSAPSVPPPPGA